MDLYAENVITLINLLLYSLKIHPVSFLLEQSYVHMCVNTAMHSEKFWFPIVRDAAAMHSNVGYDASHFIFFNLLFSAFHMSQGISNVYVNGRGYTNTLI